MVFTGSKAPKCKYAPIGKTITSADFKLMTGLYLHEYLFLIKIVNLQTPEDLFRYELDF